VRIGTGMHERVETIFTNSTRLSRIARGGIAQTLQSWTLVPPPTVRNWEMGSFRRIVCGMRIAFMGE